MKNKHIIVKNRLPISVASEKIWAWTKKGQNCKEPASFISLLFTAKRTWKNREMYENCEELLVAYLLFIYTEENSENKPKI